MKVDRVTFKGPHIWCKEAHGSVKIGFNFSVIWKKLGGVVTYLNISNTGSSKTSTDILHQNILLTFQLYTGEIPKECRYYEGTDVVDVADVKEASRIVKIS